MIGDPATQLPATWSVPAAGKLCNMTKLMPSGIEYVEVEQNIRRTNDWPCNIVSVSVSLVTVTLFSLSC